MTTTPPFTNYSFGTVQILKKSIFLHRKPSSLLPSHELKIFPKSYFLSKTWSKLKNSKFKHYKDEELVALYVDSQRNLFFEELYERYANKVYRKCYSFVYDQQKAEDFTHDIFLKLIVKIGTFKETARFSTWLYSITYNYCMDQIRVNKKQKETSIDDHFDVEEEDLSHIDEMQTEGLRKSMEKIPSDEKALLLMKYQDDFSIKEIAETLNISESAVKMRLMRSKDKLRKLYLENIAVFVLILIKIIYLFKK